MAETFKRYKDIDISFRQNPISKDIIPLYDIDAIKRAVKFLVCTDHHERPFHPEIGSSVRQQLFENFTPLTKINITRSIEEVLQNYEPRASVIDVSVIEDIDSHTLNVTITFGIANIKDPVIVSFNLERVR